MSYKKAKHILPLELLKEIQKYVEGESIYIPRRSDRKKPRGSSVASLKYFQKRNAQIFSEYLAGERQDLLSEKYFLSLKSIQRIIRQEKMIHNM